MRAKSFFGISSEATSGALRKVFPKIYAFLLHAQGRTMGG